MNDAPLASANSLPRSLLPVLPLWSWPIIGGVSALGFAPQSWWPLTVIALALLIEQTARGPNQGTVKRAFWVGWLFGLGHFTVGLRWIAVAFTYQAAMPEWLGYLGVVLLSVYLAVFPAVTAAAARWLSGGRLGLPYVLAFAGFWIITEYGRSQIFTGFAWNPLSVIAVDVAGAAQMVGTYGLSGLLLFGIGGLALVLSRHWKSGAAALAIGGAAVLSHGFMTVDDVINQKGAHQGPRVTIVQPNISQTEKYRPEYEAANFKKLAKNTIEVIPPPKANVPPRLIFWPEAAIPWSLESGMPPWIYASQPGRSAVATRAQLALLMQPGDVLITGADRFVLSDKGDIVGARNSVFAVNSDAALAPWRYDKSHLVPFGEYLPLKSVLKPLGIDRLVPGSIEFLPGPSPRTMPLKFEGRTLKMGVQVCYEIIFSGEVVDRANRPDFIFNASNDAWYGEIGPPQFLAISRLRAVEEGLPVIRATPTGISAVINPDGSLGNSLRHGVAGRIDTHLPRAGPPTFFGRYGNIIPLCLAGIFLLISYVANRRRAR